MMVEALLRNGSPSAVSSDRGVIHQFFIDVFQTSQSTAHTAQVYLAGPIRVVVILVVAFVASHLVSRLAHRLIQGLRLVSPLVRGTPRGADRVRTLAGASASVFRAVIWLVAILAVLGEFHIDLAPFIATATVIGAAIGFGAQSLVKDFLSGLLILAEDQYGVGDHVVIGTGANATSGTVESVNLRVTRLRALDGGILYVPNGDIRIVGNDTETDSQAIVDVVVPYGTDLVKAGAAAEEAARDMAEEDGWADVFVGHPVFAGVQGVDFNGVTIRVMALTRPGQHFRVAREMRLRVIERLRRDHVAWAAEGADAADGLDGADRAAGALGEGPGAGPAQPEAELAAAPAGRGGDGSRLSGAHALGESDGERGGEGGGGRAGRAAGSEAVVQRAASRIRRRVGRRPPPADA